MANPGKVEGPLAKWTRLPSTRLTDSLNDADLELMSHPRRHRQRQRQQPQNASIILLIPVLLLLLAAPPLLQFRLHQKQPNLCHNVSPDIISNRNTHWLVDDQTSQVAIPPATSSESEPEEKGNTMLTLKEHLHNIDQFFKLAARGEDDKRRRRCIICK